MAGIVAARRHIRKCFDGAGIRAPVPLPIWDVGDLGPEHTPFYEFQGRQLRRSAIGLRSFLGAVCTVG